MRIKLAHAIDRPSAEKAEGLVRSTNRTGSTLFLVLTASIILVIFSLCRNGISEEKEFSDIKKILDECYAAAGRISSENAVPLDMFDDHFQSLEMGSKHSSAKGCREWLECLRGYVDTTQSFSGLIPHYSFIDISGRAASVKVNVFSGDRHVFTDYFLLVRSSRGWKIVSNIGQESH